MGAGLVLAITVEGDRVIAYEIIADPDRLRRVDLAVLEDSGATV